MQIEILGRPISKKNSRRNFHRVSLPSIAFVKFEKYALEQLRGYKQKFEGPIIVSYTFYMKGKLDSDFDNMIGGINDILQDAGIIDNDKNIIMGSFLKVAGCPDWSTELNIKAVKHE